MVIPDNNISHVLGPHQVTSQKVMARHLKVFANRFDFQMAAP